MNTSTKVLEVFFLKPIRDRITNEITSYLSKLVVEHDGRTYYAEYDLTALAYVLVYRNEYRNEEGGDLLADLKSHIRIILHKQILNDIRTELDQKITSDINILLKIG